jgi:hypothetical protein
MLFQHLKLRSCSGEVRLDNQSLEDKTPEGVISRLVDQLIELHLVEPSAGLNLGNNVLS